MNQIKFEIENITYWFEKSNLILYLGPNGVNILKDLWDSL